MLPWFARARQILSRDERYTIYNFHREDDLQAATEILLTDEGEQPQAIRLSATGGSGRSYFLHAAAYRAEKAGQATRIGELDLDGYEVGRGSLENYVTYQLSKRSKLEASRIEDLLREVKPSLQAEGPNVLGISLFSIGIGMDVSHDRLGEILRHAVRAAAGSAEREIELLYDFFRTLGAAGRFVLHIRNRVATPATLLHRLTLCAQRFRNLILAYSEGIDDPESPAAPVGDSVRFEFPDLELYEVRAMVDRNFGDGVFSDDLIRTLWQYGSGRPAEISNGVRRLIERELLRPRGKRWEAQDEASQEELAERFEAKFYERLQAKLMGAAPGEGELMNTFLVRAALCGDLVPAGLLLEQIGLDEEARQVFLDRFDEVFEPGSAEAVFDDLAYSHPAFPKTLLYRFTLSAWPPIIAAHVAPTKRASLALQLANFLEPRLPFGTRATAELLFYFSTQMGNRLEAERFAALLQWHAGHDDSEALQQVHSEAVHSRRMDPEALRERLQQLRHVWPAHRLFAALEAYGAQPGGVPFARLPWYCDLKADLLFELGSYAAAIEAARQALSLVEGEPTLQANLHLRIGHCWIRLGDYHKGEHWFRGVLENTRTPGAGREPLEASAWYGIGMARDNLGDAVAARAGYDRALAIEEKTLGPDHTWVASTLHELARLDQAEGKYSEARAGFDRALAIKEKALGPDHTWVASTLYELAILDQAEGKYSEARAGYDRALALHEKALGPDHDWVAAILFRIANLDREEGLYDESKALFARALAFYQRAFGLEHPSTGGAASGLGATLAALGELELAEGHAATGLAVRERVLGPEHVRTAFSVWMLAKVKRAQGRRDEALELYERALRVRKAKLAADHPETTKLEAEYREYLDG